VVGPESTPIGALKITDQSSITRDYQIEKLRRFTIEGAIKRPDGSPAGHAEIMTAALNLDRGPSGSLGIASAQADADGRFHFVRERVEQMFYAFDPKSGLAAFEKIGADAERETLTLKPGATARIRLINADGKPIQNARIYVSIFCDEFTAGNPLGWDRKVSSDRNGVATIMGLALGSRCRLLAPAIDKDVAVTIANIEVKEVKDFDLGEIVPKAGSK
jgi:hypothetical protein